jgi:hypothetical protein
MAPKRGLGGKKGDVTAPTTRGIRDFLSWSSSTNSSSSSSSSSHVLPPPPPLAPQNAQIIHPLRIEEDDEMTLSQVQPTNQSSDVTVIQQQQQQHDMILNDEADNSRPTYEHQKQQQFSSVNNDHTATMITEGKGGGERKLAPIFLPQKKTVVAVTTVNNNSSSSSSSGIPVITKNSQHLPTSFANAHFGGFGGIGSGSQSQSQSQPQQQQQSLFSQPFSSSSSSSSSSNSGGGGFISSPTGLKTIGGGSNHLLPRGSLVSNGGGGGGQSLPPPLSLQPPLALHSVRSSLRRFCIDSSSSTLNHSTLGNGASSFSAAAAASASSSGGNSEDEGNGSDDNDDGGGLAFLSQTQQPLRQGVRPRQRGGGGGGGGLNALRSDSLTEIGGGGGGGGGGESGHGHMGLFSSQVGSGSGFTQPAITEGDGDDGLYMSQSIMFTQQGPTTTSSSNGGMLVPPPPAPIKNANKSIGGGGGGGGGGGKTKLLDHFKFQVIPAPPTNPFLPERARHRPLVRASRALNLGKKAEVSHYLKNFEEVSFLGGGAFAKVYRVRSRVDGCAYAVKKRLQQLRGSSDSDKRISEMREVLVMAALASACPHILHYHTAWIETLGVCDTNEDEFHAGNGSGDSFLYIQTELAWGSLEDAVRGTKPVIARGASQIPLPQPQVQVRTASLISSSSITNSKIVQSSQQQQHHHHQHHNHQPILSSSTLISSIGPSSISISSNQPQPQYLIPPQSINGTSSNGGGERGKGGDTYFNTAESPTADSIRFFSSSSSNVGGGGGGGGGGRLRVDTVDAVTGLGLGASCPPPLEKGNRTRSRTRSEEGKFKYRLSRLSGLSSGGSNTNGIDLIPGQMMIHDEAVEDEEEDSRGGGGVGVGEKNDQLSGRAGHTAFASRTLFHNIGEEEGKNKTNEASPIITASLFKKREREEESDTILQSHEMNLLNSHLHPHPLVPYTKEDDLDHYSGHKNSNRGGRGLFANSRDGGEMLTDKNKNNDFENPNRQSEILRIRESMLSKRIKTNDYYKEEEEEKKEKSNKSGQDDDQSHTTHSLMGPPSSISIPIPPIQSPLLFSSSVALPPETAALPLPAATRFPIPGASRLASKSTLSMNNTYFFFFFSF